jgi:hypothetical protein
MSGANQPEALAGEVPGVVGEASEASEAGAAGDAGEAAASAVLAPKVPDVVWRVASAVVIGSDHRRSSNVCQDAAVVRRVVGPRGERLVVVACDGAGSAKHGEVGAQVVSQAASRLLAAASERDLADPEALARRLLNSVRSAVASRASAMNAQSRDLSTTMLAALVDPTRAVFFQVGDGAIVVGRGDELSVVFWPAKGQHANETSFVTSDDAASRLEVMVLDDPTRSVDEVAVFTDGLERLALDFAKQAAFGAFFEPMFATVRELPLSRAELNRAEATLSIELDAFLGSARIEDATGDDKTLVLATRRDAAT